MVTLKRRAKFSAAHFYYLPELSEEENLKLFKKCSNRKGHGHNYLLEVDVAGEINPKTSIIVNFKDVKEVINQEVVEKLDHKNLNLEVEYFSNKLPTLENLSVFIWQALESKFREKGVELRALKLSEDEDLYVEYYGEGAS